MPEYLLGIMITAILGWGGFTWRRAEDAIVAAIKADDRVDRLEVKIAENYLTKQEFQGYMDRLFEPELCRYLTERVDYHVNEQANEARSLRSENDRLKGGK